MSRLGFIQLSIGLVCASVASAAPVAGETGADGPAPAPPSLPISGRVFSDLYVPIRDVESSTYRQASTSVWLQGDPRLGENGFARLLLSFDGLQAQVAAGPSEDSRYRVRVREGYVGYSEDGWELRVGQQIIPWGKSDAINPTDFLTAKDYTFFNPDEEVRRLGATSLWLNWAPAQGNSPLGLTAVVTPAFARSQLLIPPTAVPPGAALGLDPRVPPQTLGNTETALKVSYAGSGWDASLSAFRGFNHMPEFVLDGVSGAFPQLTANVTQAFHHIRAMGGDASLTSGNWILRAESAYVWTENDDGADPLIQPSHWDTVAGVERPIGDDFRLQLQLYYRYYPRFSDPATSAIGSDPVTAQINRGIAQANALLLGYQDRSRPGATLRLGYAHEASGVDAELFLIGNFAGGDYLIRPKLSYSWTDALRTTAGVDYHGGPDDRPLGALKVYDSVFLEAKYSF